MRKRCSEKMSRTYPDYITYPELQFKQAHFAKSPEATSARNYSRPCMLHRRGCFPTAIDPADPRGSERKRKRGGFARRVENKRRRSAWTLISSGRRRHHAVHESISCPAASGRATASRVHAGFLGRVRHVGISRCLERKCRGERGWGEGNATYVTD